MLTLAAHELPALLEPALRHEIATQGVRKQLPAGAMLLNLNDTIQYLPLVLHGRLQVKMFSTTGAELLLYEIVQPETCMMTLQAALNSHQSQIKAVVDDNCELILLPVAAVRSWQNRYPSWTQFVLQLYYARFREMASVVEQLAFHNTQDRLWQLLQHQATQAGTQELSTTHQQLADALGTAREVVSRLLKGMEAQGKLQLGRGHIKIVAAR